VLALLSSSNYPGPKAPFGGYLGASLDHSVFALWFTAFIIGQSDATRSIQPHLRHRMRASG
jgi:hypothetical protein